MDRRQGEPRQSSLPSSLHPHLVTRPPAHEAQPEASTSSRGERFVHRGLREGRVPADLNLQLAPIAPITPPVAPGPPPSAGAPQLTGGRFEREREVLQGGYHERVVRPLPRHRGPSSIPHGLPLPPSSSGTLFGVDYTYTAYMPRSLEPAPQDYNFSTRRETNRSHSPPRLGANPAISLAPLRIAQGSQGSQSDQAAFSMTTHYPDDPRLTLPPLSIQGMVPIANSPLLGRPTHSPYAPRSLNEPRSAREENQGTLSVVFDSMTADKGPLF